MKQEEKVLSYVGQKFNHLTITGSVKAVDNRTLATVICECGTQKQYRLSDILRNHVTSCGCQTSARLSSNLYTIYLIL